MVPELESSSGIWNSIMSADANKLERIQWMFAALCYNCLFPYARYNYANALVYLKQHALRQGSTN
jgi:preprotein translocase subunit SecB